MATFTRYLLFAGIIENDTNKTWKLEQWALYQDPLDHNSWTVRLVFFIECRMCWWNSWPGTVIHIGSAVFKCLRHIKSMVTCSIFFFLPVSSGLCGLSGVDLCVVSPWSLWSPSLVPRPHPAHGEEKGSGVTSWATWSGQSDRKTAFIKKCWSENKYFNRTTQSGVMKLISFFLGLNTSLGSRRFSLVMVTKFASRPHAWRLVSIGIGGFRYTPGLEPGEEAAHESQSISPLILLNSTYSETWNVWF